MPANRRPAALAGVVLALCAISSVGAAPRTPAGTIIWQPAKPVVNIPEAPVQYIKAHDSVLEKTELNTFWAADPTINQQGSTSSATDEAVVAGDVPIEGLRYPIQTIDGLIQPLPQANTTKVTGNEDVLSALTADFVPIYGGCLPSVDDNGQIVRCVDSFAISKYEVTNAAYRLFDPTHSSGDYLGHQLDGDDQPVVFVTAADAQAYAQWLSRRTGQHYRLPTPEEWEFAARSGASTLLPWGDADKQSLACQYANVADRTAAILWPEWVIHDCSDSFAFSAPVGMFQPNAWNVYDMIGNVWEWTCPHADFGCDATRMAVARGGSWFNAPDSVNIPYQYTLDNDKQASPLVGFRLVRINK